MFRATVDKTTLIYKPIRSQKNRIIAEIVFFCIFLAVKSQNGRFWVLASSLTRGAHVKLNKIIRYNYDKSYR